MSFDGELASCVWRIRLGSVLGGVNSVRRGLCTLSACHSFTQPGTRDDALSALAGLAGLAASPDLAPANQPPAA